MYKTIVAARTRRVFHELNAGRSDELIKGLAPGCEHVMHGRHALSGARHSVESIHQWYDRLFRLLPQVEFELGSIVVRGMPWRTIVAAEWQDRADLTIGRYQNAGVNVIELRWGRVTKIHVHCDTQRIAEVCSLLAEKGIAEAEQAPIAS